MFVLRAAITSDRSNFSEYQIQLFEFEPFQLKLKTCLLLKEKPPFSNCSNIKTNTLVISQGVKKVFNHQFFLHE